MLLLLVVVTGCALGGAAPPSAPSASSEPEAEPAPPIEVFGTIERRDGDQVRVALAADKPVPADVATTAGVLHRIRTSGGAAAGVRIQDWLPIARVEVVGLHERVLLLRVLQEVTEQHGALVKVSHFRAGLEVRLVLDQPAGALPVP